jgi:hypothetical protein
MSANNNFIKKTKLFAVKHSQTLETILDYTPNLLFFGMIFAVIFFTSCRSDDDPIPQHNVRTQRTTAQRVPSSPLIDEPITVPATFHTNINPFIGLRSTTTDLTSGEVSMYVDNNTTPTYYYTDANVLTPRTAADELYLSSLTSTLLNAYYPKSALSESGNGIEITVKNDKGARTKNKDVVYATTTVVKTANNTYSMQFKHLFSLLEVEIIQGTTTENINNYYPLYAAKGRVKLSHPLSDNYTLEGSLFTYWFFDGDNPNSYGCIIPNDEEGILTINDNFGIKAQLNIKDYFHPLEAGKVYKLTITVNQHSYQVGNLTIDNWMGGNNSSITINS